MFLSPAMGDRPVSGKDVSFNASLFILLVSRDMLSFDFFFFFDCRSDWSGDKNFSCHIKLVKYVVVICFQLKQGGHTRSSENWFAIFEKSAF